jgi:hypothetical protein
MRFRTDTISRQMAALSQEPLRLSRRNHFLYESMTRSIWDSQGRLLARSSRSNDIPLISSAAKAPFEWVTR